MNRFNFSFSTKSACEIRSSLHQKYQHQIVFRWFIRNVAYRTPYEREVKKAL